MKRRELVRRLEEWGCVLVRHGAKYDWYQNPETKMAQPVPRHAEIKEPLAKHILKLCGTGRANHPNYANPNRKMLERAARAQ